MQDVQRRFVRYGNRESLTLTGFYAVYVILRKANIQPLQVTDPNIFFCNRIIIFLTDCKRIHFTKYAPTILLSNFFEN